MYLDSDDYNVHKKTFRRNTLLVLQSLSPWHPTESDEVRCTVKIDRICPKQCALPTLDACGNLLARSKDSGVCVEVLATTASSQRALIIQIFHSVAFETYSWALNCMLNTRHVFLQHTLAYRIRPSDSGYFSWTALVTASHVGASRWHQGHQGA